MAAARTGVRRLRCEGLVHSTGGVLWGGGRVEAGRTPGLGGGAAGPKPGRGRATAGRGPGRGSAAGCFELLLELLPPVHEVAELPHQRLVLIEGRLGRVVVLVEAGRAH